MQKITTQFFTWPVFTFLLSLFSTAYAELPQIPEGPDGELLRCEQVYDDEYGDCWANIVNARNDRRISFSRARLIIRKRIIRIQRSRRIALRNRNSELAKEFASKIAQYKSMRLVAKQCHGYYEEVCYPEDTPTPDPDEGEQGLGAACTAIGSAVERSSRSRLFPRIVNGAVCEQGSTSWVPLYNQGFQWCTGNMIAPNVVLTAAHCIEDQNCSDFTVTDGMGNTARGSTCTAHPSYNFPFYDLAVIQLNRTLNTELVEIWQNADVQLGETVVLAGYGRNKSEAGEDIEEGALLATFNVVTDVNDQHISIEYDPSDVSFGNSCNGDSGGGLAVQREGKWVLVGVVSGGDAENCGIFGDETDNSFWTNATSSWALNFIRNNTSGIID